MLGGKEIAKRNLKVLQRIYEPDLTDLRRRAATEWHSKLIVHYVKAKYGPDKFPSKVVTVGAGIEKWVEKWGIYPSRTTNRVDLGKGMEESGFVFRE